MRRTRGWRGRPRTGVRPVKAAGGSGRGDYDDGESWPYVMSKQRRVHRCSGRKLIRRIASGGVGGDVAGDGSLGCRSFWLPQRHRSIVASPTRMACPTRKQARPINSLRCARRWGLTPAGSAKAFIFSGFPGFPKVPMPSSAPAAIAQTTQVWRLWMRHTRIGS